jgi:iron complex outermembrane receptor protein
MLISKSNTEYRNGSVRGVNLATASGLALMVVLSASQVAQAQEQSEAVEAVTVSSSRIMSAGFDAPTPTTVIGAADIQKQANTNVFTTISQLPSLMGSTGVSVGNGGSSNGTNGLSALNIRGIGTNRNLILIDGERVVPAASIGVNDISQFPQMLIQRVDVVTGGASASWGSDAVSGVVNFIIDKKFEGFKANINGGITNYADDPQAQAQFAAGTSFAGGKAHVELSGEFTSEAGVNSITGPRKWYQNPQQLQMYTAAQCRPNGCPGGAPMWDNVNNAKLALFSYGGLITRGPLQGTAFGANGSTYQYNYGYGVNGLPATPARNGTNAITNCSTGGYCIGGDTSGNQTGYASMVARLVRGNAFMRMSYDLTPGIEVYATGMYSEVVTWNKPTQSAFKADNLQIGCDNAFLSTAISAACTANAGPGGAYAPTAAVAAAGVGAGMAAGSFTYGAQNSQLTNVENYNNRVLRRFVVGTDGVFNTLGTDWTFKGYVEHGESDFHNALENILLTNYYTAAIDAVTVTPGNAGAFAGVPVGSTVCRSAAARSIGCVPLNIIGTTGATPAALAFVQGTNAATGASSGGLGRNPYEIVNQRQEVVDFSVSGSPIDDWAGKVSIATGFTYREEAINATSDCASVGNCANQNFDGVNWGAGGDPLLNASAGGGLPPANPNWYAGNFQPSRGSFHEWEAFVETNVPLMDSQEFGHIDANLAGRYTHYTTSGDVETWKVGATWDTPLDGLRLRALQSRDVRAPNLAELYAGARVNTGFVTDDFPLNGVSNQTITPVNNPITANAELKPEKGQTTELGAVWAPSEVPGLNLSATYYRLGVQGIITQLTQQQEMDLCFNGNAQQCSFISSNGTPWAVNGVINTAATLTRPSSQITPSINIASIVTDGMDYEASYQFALDDMLPSLGLGGDMTWRLLATNVMKYVTNPGIIGAPILETAGTNTSASSTPHWKIFFTQGYDTDRWGLFLNERWFSEGVVNRNWVACASACPAPIDTNHPTVNSNYMPGELYFDIGGHYDVTPVTSLWFKIDNLTNQNPGNAYNYSPTTQSPPTTPQLYDMLGRFYHIGIRITN